MPSATQVFPSFLGGEISQFAQGRFDRPDYRVSMRTCLNSFPVEIGAWTRRSGSQYGGHTRGGATARAIKFDFEQANAVTMEFTDGYLRFRSGPTLITSNDAQTIVAISTANPAVVQLASAVTWATGDTAILPGASTPLLENRQVKLTKVDTTHFSIADAISGTSIDGSTLGALASGATIERIHELTTVYAAGLWSSVRAVQAETTSILLHGSLAPQALTVTTLPTAALNAQFAIGSLVFSDGPYLDPFTNGVQATPSAKTGIITLSLSFPAYSATKAYAASTFVSYSGVNYISLIDQNVGNTPNTSPSAWTATSANAAINSGSGFSGTDVGRLVRLYSEPPAWDVATAYTTGNTVGYNPSGQPGATTYYIAAASSTGVAPGTENTKWTLLTSSAAIWTWGRITSLSNIIDRALPGSANLGDMTAGGGLSAAFDGVFTQAAAASAEKVVNYSGTPLPNGTIVSVSGYVGKNYSGASDQAILQAVVYPSSNFGLAFGGSSYLGTPAANVFAPVITLNLRGKSSAPSSASDGTILGTSNFIFNTTSPVTLTSSDSVTAWKYVWIEATATATLNHPFGYSDAYTFSLSVAEVSFFSPPGTSTSAGINVEILGPPLLYTADIRTWRLGAYSNATGWPTCGTYHEGRLWLGGAIANRFDACVSNGISGNTVNFAPTDQFGAVAASNAISYTLNSDGVNPMYWMQPDLQGVVIGTQAGEWLVQAPTSGPIAPANIAARRMTKHGSENILPVRTEHTNLFVKRYGKKLLEYFADAYSGKFSAPNLADKAEHVISAGIAEIAYTEAATPILWGRDGNNALFGMTYRRTTLSTAQGPDFYAWHRHTLGSGRTVESICSGPSVGGDLDTLTMVTTDSTGIRYVELLTDVPDENKAFVDSWYVDSGVRPTSVLISTSVTAGTPYGSYTINGLWHLNGKTVQVFAGALDLGDRGAGTSGYTDFVVANGSITVPFADGVNSGPGGGMFTQAFAEGLTTAEIAIGFTYNSDGQIVRLLQPAETGARNGPALGAPSRTHRCALKLVNTKGLSYGGNFSSLDPCLFKTSGGADLAATQTFSGIFYDQVHDDFTYEDSLCWRVTRPFPATITACAQNLRTEDM